MLREDQPALSESLAHAILQHQQSGSAAVDSQSSKQAPEHPLDDIERFLGRFVVFPSKHERVAHTLWIVHAHLMDAWESTPRIAFLSPEPGSGKSRALEVTELLVPRPVCAVNVTPAYLFRKVGDEQGRPTILYDEIDTVFGPKARDSNEEIRGLLNAGHRRHATAGRCVVIGKIVKTEELPAYCAVALAGLGDLPDTILTRSVIVRMRRRAPDELIEPYRQREHSVQAKPLFEKIQSWAACISGSVAEARPQMPDGVLDRDADVWEPLLAVADAAGGQWPKRARSAAIALVAQSQQSTPSLGVRLLADLREIFAGKEALSTDSIITALCSMDEAPWSDLRGKPINPRGLAERLKQYGIKSKNVRIDLRVLKGYERSDFVDAWRRYLGASQPGNATAATAATSESDVAGVAHVAPIMAEVPSARDLSGNAHGESHGRTATAAEVEELRTLLGLLLPNLPDEQAEALELAIHDPDHALPSLREQAKGKLMTYRGAAAIRS